MSLPIWEGYPHSTSVLRSNGIERVLDYHPINQPTPDLTYATEFISPTCPGIYLKWLNPSAGYKYYLFSNVVENRLKTSDLGDIQNNYTSRIDAMTRVHDIGKKAQHTLNIFSRVKKEYMDDVQTLLYAREVYLYTELMPLKLPFSNCGWIKVQIQAGTFVIENTKNNTEELRLRLLLPELYVQKLI